MENKRHILFLTQAKPFSGFGGENMRSSGLLSILQANNYLITAITGSEGNSLAEQNKLLAHYYLNDLPNTFVAKFNSLFKTDRSIISAINKIHLDRKIDVAFIDYMFMGQYISTFKNLGIPVIYGTHNAQADLTHQELKTLSGFTKVIRWGAWRLQRIHERRFFPTADRLIVVSDKDKKYHHKFCDHKKVIEIPNFLNTNDYPHYTETENYIVVSGNFSSYQNREGTEWFINNVWLKNDFGNLSLALAGFGSDNLLKEMQRTNNLQNVFATDSSESIKEVIGKAKAAIVPLLQGSGSRFKILEALALGIPVISTTKGAEGIDSPWVIVADNSNTIFNSIINLLNSNMSSPILPQKNTYEYNNNIVNDMLRLIVLR